MGVPVQAVGEMPGPVILSVSPIPKAGQRRSATPQVRWSTGDGSPGLVTVAPEGGKELPYASSAEGSGLAPWIAAGHLYIFRLYSIVSGRLLLARFKVGEAAAAEITALPPKPRNTPPAVDRLLQLLSFAVLGVLAMLTLAYVREVKHSGR